MTELPTDTCPLAYVSMSSAPDLDLVYVKVVRPVLEYAGFSCRRGSGESIIIADALDKIDEVDLIVCDLTHNRPQAFYDLGIAHSFRKKTIIMSQETAEIPFDTRYQRAVAYKDDRFSLIELRETFLSALKFMFPEGATTSPSEAQVEQIAPISISELDSARVAISHENSDARRYALRVLGDHRDEESYDRIHRLIQSGAPDDVVREALTTLHKIDPERAKDEILGKNGLWNSSHLVRERAVNLIAEYLKTDFWVDRLLKQITDSSWGVRVAVCQVFGKWMERKAEASLYARCKLDQEQAVRVAAEDALINIHRAAGGHGA